ncbi:MAG: hypothetical protein WBE76_03570 [Terracidiphilus sp.]
MKHEAGDEDSGALAAAEALYRLIELLASEQKARRIPDRKDRRARAGLSFPIRSAERATMNAECSWGAFWYLKSLRATQGQVTAPNT